MFVKEYLYFKWKMVLNYSKCKIMHIGKNNPENSYFIGYGQERVMLEVTELERDLGIMFSANGSNREQVLTSVTRANRMLGIIKKNF